MFEKEIWKEELPGVIRTMINSFRQYLVEEDRVLYFSFGRMNPPTIGHQKLLDKLASESGKNPYRLYLSQSQDPKKNPLDYKTKVKFARKMFPKHARYILSTPNIKTVMDSANQMYNEGYRKIVMVVGSDRISEFKKLLEDYNGKTGRHGFYNFQEIKVISAGERDPDSEGVEGMSASKMRDLAKKNDFVQFSQGLPSTLSNKDSREIFNAVRKGMGLSEVKEFHTHIKLNPISEAREAYVNGDLFHIGDQVIIKETEEVAVVKRLGSNYVIVETDKATYRKWLDSVEKLEESDKWYKDQPEWGTPESTKKAKKNTPGQNEQGACWDGYKQVGMKSKNGKMVPNCVKEKIEVAQDPDIDHKKGSQPATFFKGVKSASTKSKRDAHFKKMTKKADDDPTAYKPAPGDATAKTQPSQYTKKFKQMYGEGIDLEESDGKKRNRELYATGRISKDEFDKRMGYGKYKTKDNSKKLDGPGGIYKNLVKRYSEGTALDAAKETIKKEKERDRERHDRMLDRARMVDVTRKNKITK